MYMCVYMHIYIYVCVCIYMYPEAESSCGLPCSDRSKLLGFERIETKAFGSERIGIKAS